MVGRLQQARRRSADPGLELAGDGQLGVAELLKVEASQRERGEQAVVGIDPAESGPLVVGPRVLSGRGPLVGLAGDDEPVEGLEAPAGFDEAQGQPVEQLGMARGFGAQAEVAGGLDQAGAEVVLSDAID